VTRAAARVGLTQSGMSNALAQLRRVFDDPLFVRSRGGVEPTLRALALADPVRRGLQAFQEAMAEPRDFDPSTSDASFAIAMNDFAELIVVPPLVRALARRAPGVSLQVLPAWGDAPGLGTGEVDVAILSPGPQRPPGTKSEPLLDDDLVCIVRKGHPRIRGRLTLPAYLRESHVLVSQERGGSSAVDTVLARMGKQRRIAARVPRFFMVPTLVAETDLVGMVDSRIAKHFARHHPLRILKRPIRLPKPKEWAYHLYWHVRSDGDPARAWLRALIAEVASKL